MSRDLWVGLVVGLILGWLIEWVIDWVYWRKKYNQIMRECGDQFILISGVGPAIQERFYDAGIFTFEQLGKLSTEEVERIIGKAQNLADEQAMIDQAKKFAREKAAARRKAE